jgi:predicted AlkP superfamily phosphohydrolase/phosphomutase
MRFPFLFLLVLAAAASQFSCAKRSGSSEKEKPVVVILGLDGANWELIDPLIAKGRLPLFKEFKEKCAWGYLRTVTPAKSPIVWTSIGSGKTKNKHGIEDFRSKRITPKGKYPICNSLDIREPMLWEMLDAQGRRSVLVNWYLSSPPQPLNGVNVSDSFRSSALAEPDKRKGPLEHSVFPQSRAAELAKFLDPDYRRVLKRMNLPDYPARYEKVNAGKSYLDEPIFRKYPEWVLQEGLVTKVAEHLFRSEDFDLFAAYYKLPDVVQHFAFMSLIDDAYKKTLDRSVVNGELPVALQSEAYSKIADIVCPIYQNLESSIRRYLEVGKHRESYFIILSDHGFSFFFREKTVRYNHVGPEKAPDGILIVRGPGVKPGKIKLARIYDIAPTVLYLLGLPLDRNMDGEPLRRVFSFKRDSRYTVYRKKKALPSENGFENDEKKLQELKALGYLN